MDASHFDIEAWLVDSTELEVITTKPFAYMDVDGKFMEEGENLQVPATTAKRLVNERFAEYSENSKFSEEILKHLTSHPTLVDVKSLHDLYFETFLVVASLNEDTNTMIALRNAAQTRMLHLVNLAVAHADRLEAQNATFRQEGSVSSEFMGGSPADITFLNGLTLTEKAVWEQMVRQVTTGSLRIS